MKALPLMVRGLLSCAASFLIVFFEVTLAFGTVAVAIVLAVMFPMLGTFVGVLLIVWLISRPSDRWTNRGGCAPRDSSPAPPVRQSPFSVRGARLAGRRPCCLSRSISVSRSSTTSGRTLMM